MNRMAIALTMALGLAAAQKASAVTDIYGIKGSSCTSITSGITGLYGIYGVSPPGAAGMNVTCPVQLPQRTYTQFGLTIYGYGRSTPDKVSCTIATTGYDGTNYSGATAVLTANQANSQWSSTTLYPVSWGDEMYILCHIPGSTVSGPSYLSQIDFTATY